MIEKRYDFSIIRDKPQTDTDERRFLWFAFIHKIIDALANRLIELIISQVEKKFQTTAV